jgi:subtilisin family serine protease
MRSLFMILVLAVALAACARGPASQVPSSADRIERDLPTPDAAAAVPNKIPQNVEVQDHPDREPGSSPSTLAASVPPSQVAPEDLPVEEEVRGSQKLRVQVVRRKGKYPLIRREEILRDGTPGAPVIGVHELVADHLVVELAPGQDPQTVAAAVGGTVRHRIPGSPMVLIAFPYTAHSDYDRYTQRAKGQPGVREVGPDTVVSINAIPDDTDFSQLWGMQNAGQSNGVVDADIDAPEAWDISTGSKSVLVGVIDTGIDRTHVDLSANMWTNPGETGLDAQGRDKAANGIDDDNNSFIDDWRGWDFVNGDNDPSDDNGHGTHCAGTIGAVGGNRQGVTGVCWNVSMVAIKALAFDNKGFFSDIIGAHFYANAIGCDVTSNSYGGGASPSDVAGMRHPIDTASRRGSLVVAAAGNLDWSDGWVGEPDNDKAPIYPASINSPAVIAVAATDRSDRLAAFSHYGAATVHLAAPGVDIRSCAPGNGYATMSGTSMATPHVAGACALLKAANPQLTGPQIKAILLAQVDPLTDLYGKTVTGGRLNLFRAVKAATGRLVALSAVQITELGNSDGLLNAGESADLAVSLAKEGFEGFEPSGGLTGVLSSNSASVRVVQGTSVYGNIAPGQSSAGSARYRVAIAASSSAPQVVSLTLTVNGGIAGPKTFPITLSIANSASLRVVVRRSGSNAPVPGATVSWTGTATGTATTNASGQFSAIVPAGSYQVDAAAPGLKSSGSVSATVPSAASLTLTLAPTSSAMVVTPTSLNLSKLSSTAVVTIANTGASTLAWKASPSSGSALTSGLWHRVTDRTWSGSGTAWYFGFDNAYPRTSQLPSSGALQFSELVVPAYQPTLTFASWSPIDPGSPAGGSQNPRKKSIQISVDRGLSWTTVGSALSRSQEWVRSSIDLSSYAGRTVAIRFWYEDPVSNDGLWYLDDITVGGKPVTAWFFLSQTQGTVAARASGTVTVSADFSEASAGLSTGSIKIVDTAANGTSTSVAVTLLNGPLLTASPSPLILTAEQGTTPASGTLLISNLGSSPMGITVAATDLKNTATAATGLWHQTTARTLAGAPVWWYGDEVKGTYDTGGINSGSLTFTGLTIPQENAVLTWQHWRQTETDSAYDTCRVEILIMDSYVYQSYEWRTLATVTDRDGQWKTNTIDLSSYRGYSTQLRFIFDTRDDQKNSYEGWYIGEVRMGGTPIGASWLIANPATATIAPGSSIAVQIQAAVSDFTTGSYNGKIQVMSAGANEKFDIPVICHVIASGMEISTPSVIDLGTPPFEGDADGIPEAGETVALQVPLTNNGGQSVTNVRVAVSSDSPLVTFPRAAETLNSIGGLGGRAIVNLPIAISANCPVAKIPLSVLVTYDQGSKTISSSFFAYPLPSATITGTVRLDGAGFGGVTVRYEFYSDGENYSNGGSTSGSVTTAADGTYSIPAIQSDNGVYVISVLGYGSPSRQVRARSTGVDFSLTTLTVRGTARLDGVPLSDVTISGFGNMTMTTKADGTYVSSRIIRSNNITDWSQVNLVASKLGSHSTIKKIMNFQLQPNQNAIDFEFVTSRVTGKVVDAGSGSPITGATVRWMSPHEGRNRYWDGNRDEWDKDLSYYNDGEVSTDANGTFSFSGGIYGDEQPLYVEVVKDGYTSYANPVFQKAVNVFNINLPSQTNLTVQLVTPRIGVAPSSLAVSIVQGQSTTRDITISNSGGQNISGNSPPLSWHQDFPYSISTSDDLDGPKFGLVMLNLPPNPPVGTLVPMQGSRVNVGPIPIGFSFPFYGNKFTTFRLGSSGWLSFTSLSNDLGGSFPNGKRVTLPSVAAPENLISFNGVNTMFFDAHSWVAYKTIDNYQGGKALIVQFDQATYEHRPEIRFSGEVILKEDGSIIMLYNDDGAGLSNPLIGIQNATRTVGTTLQANYQPRVMRQGMAVRLSPTVPNWLSLNPTAAGTLNPGSTTTVRASFDASKLAVGTHTTTLVIESNATNAPRVSIPVTLTVTPSNTPPTISDIADRTITEDGNTGAIPFTIGDAETSATALTVTVASSNTALVPFSSIVLGGSGANRTVTVMPTSNAFGTAIITLTVSDGTLTTVDRFTLTVTPVNDRPTVTDIPDRATTTGKPIGPLAFTIGDAETRAGSLLIAARSNNSTLVPVNGVVFAGTDANRTVTINPAAGQNGTSVITIIVSDGYLAVTNSITVTVGPVGAIGDGLAATYFNNKDFTGTTVLRIDPQVNFNWGNGSPDPAIHADTFSVRWTGQVLPAFSETYTFYTTSDEGIRLSVNGVRIIDNWASHAAVVNTGTVKLTAGVRANILLEYFENTGSAVTKLEWSSPRRTREVVPQSRLFSAPAGIGALLPDERSGVEALALWSDLARPALLLGQN